MTTIKKGLRIGALNANGISTSIGKQEKILTKLIKDECDLIILTDTRLTTQDVKNSPILYNHETYVVEPIIEKQKKKTSRKRGVLILKPPGSEATLTSFIDKKDGNRGYIKVDHPKAKPFYLAGTYGPNTDDPSFFTELVQEVLDKRQPALAIGDMNIKLDNKMDIQPPTLSPPTETKVHLINELIDDGIISDAFRYLHPETKAFSYMHPSQLPLNQKQKSRIDIPLANPQMLDLVNEVQYVPMYRADLDHSAIYIDIDSGNFQKAKNPPFRVPNYLLDDQNYVKEIRESIRDHAALHLKTPKSKEDLDMTTDYDLFSAPMTVGHQALFESILQNAKFESKRFSKIRNEQKQKERHLLESEVINAKIATEQNPSEDSLSHLTTAELKLTTYNNKQDEERLSNFKINWNTNHEKPSKSFFQTLKNQGCSKTITRISTKDGIKRNTKDINNALHEHFSKTFEYQECNDSLDAIKKFTGDTDDDLPPALYPAYLLEADQKIPTLSTIEKARLEGKLSLDDLSASLKQRPDKSAPGICGFSARWVKTLWNTIKYPFYNSYLESLDKEYLPGSQRSGLISLLPKPNKDRTQIENLRPITLLSIFYKIISGAYANRLKTVLDKIIHPNQKAYLEGRYIGEVTKSLHDAMHDLETNQKDATIVLIDFSKAFDTISHKFIFNCMKLMNFGTQFIDGIKLLLTNRHSQINNSGHLSKGFNLQRGVPQGDPISAYLFILSLEFLLINLRNNSRIQKTTLSNGCKIFDMSYADDLTLIIPRDKTTIHGILDTLKSFRNLSGLEVNLKKTVCINIGKNRDPTPFDKTIPLPFETTFKLLGINFTCNADDTDQNYDTIFKLIEESMKFWSRRIFTPLGRIMALKTFILSKYTHKALVLPSPPKKWCNDLQLKITSFIFQRKSFPIARSQLSLPISQGGYNIPDIETFWNNLKIKLLLKTTHSKDAYSTLFNKKLNDLNHINITDLTKKGPETIRQVAIQLNDPFWTPTLTAWSQCVTGFAVTSDKALLNTPILDNPIFGKPWNKKLKTTKMTIFGEQKSPITQADFGIDLRDLCFKHVLNHDTFVDRPTLEGIIGQKVSTLEYIKILPILKTGKLILQTIPKKTHDQDIFTWTKGKKGTKHLRSLISYTAPQTNQLTSTKYWRRIPEIETTDQEIFKKSFKYMNSIPISSKDKNDILKIKHNTVGTPHIRSKYTDTPNDCTFCALEKRDPHASCIKFGLPEILLTCKTTKKFVDTITMLPCMDNMHFKTDPISRLLYQEHPRYSAELNFIHTITNLYLRKTAYYAKLPTKTSFLTFLHPRTTLAINRQNHCISETFLTSLLSDIESHLQNP